jgi:hypothetical protein
MRRVLLALWALAATAWPTPASASTRQSRPLTVAGAANAMLPSLGVDVSYQLNDRIAVGAQLTMLLIVHNDLSARGRLFLVAGERYGLYVGANLHGWYSPLILDVPTIAATAELGYELRTDAGFTLGVGAGGGLLWVPGHAGVGGRKPRWDPLPMLNLRIGRSW